MVEENEKEAGEKDKEEAKEVTKKEKRLENYNLVGFSGEEER